MISYSHNVSQNIQDAIPAEHLDKLDAIYSQNNGTVNTSVGWMGSLSSFRPGDGYWVIANEPFVFSYNHPQGSALARENFVPEIPFEYDYYQSASQAFYFIKDIDLTQSNIEEGDWIVAYNDATVVGARMWSGEYTDIPVMGFDETDESTINYCQPGQSPTFVLHKTATGESIELSTDHMIGFQSNQFFVVELEDMLLPQEVVLHGAYPNPFNPTTSISYDIPEGGMNVNMSIYDLRGRLVTELVNEFQEGSADSYQVMWNASNASSGIYLLVLNAGNDIKTQKITLIK